MKKRRSYSAKMGLKVRIIRKLAPVINGIDLTTHKVGDVIELPHAMAMMLVLEGWAELMK